MVELTYALVTAGVIMVLAEVLIPGGIVGSIGVLCLAAGVVLGFSHDPVFGFVILVGAVVFGIAFFGLWVKYFPKSRLGKKLFLSQDAHEWHSYDDETRELVGSRGHAHTPLRPSGTAVVNGRRLDVVTRGEMIPGKTPVKVLAVHGNRIIVEAAEDENESESAN